MPDIGATTSQQVLKSMDISLLKGLKNVVVEFECPGLTAIMGPNGVGKSTVLHALACCYKPMDGESRDDYKFSQFFTPTTEALWQGSNFSITHSYRIGTAEHNNIVSVFSKASDRWSPKYQRRIERSVSYIGITTCVPRIEKEKKSSFIRFSDTTELMDALSVTIRQKASLVMNRDYSHYRMNSANRTNYKGVEFGTDRYSELSMGAGEQRIFYILEQVFKAPKYSMILIDELDLLLQTDER